MINEDQFGQTKTSYSYFLLLILILIGILGIVVLYATRSSVDNNISNTANRVFLLDETVTHFVNQFVRQNPFIDRFIFELARNNLFKGGFSMAILLYLWFRCDDPEDQRRGAIMSTILVAVLGVLAVRVMTHFLPYRERPLHTPVMNLTQPYFMDNDSLIGWSSFPSDHATLFFTLATGIYLIMRPLGILALFHAALIICLPRLYLGFHWSTDLLVGSVIGVFMGLLGNMPFIRNFIHRLVLRIAHFNRPLFYTAFFLISFQVITLFEESRNLVSFAYYVLRGYF